MQRKPIFGASLSIKLTTQFIIQPAFYPLIEQ
jgi:hypothetical protein